MRTTWILGLTAALCLGLTGSASGQTYEIDYASYDVTLTDSQGVKTELTEFGFWTGPNILVAYRGDSKVEIPFRRIRTLEIQKYLPVKGHSPATVTTKQGKTYKVEIERFDGQRYLGGKSEFGSLRIQLKSIARLELKRLSHTTPDNPRE
jgi:hypothetical protein